MSGLSQGSGSQPASGGLGGSIAGGFELIGPGVGMAGGAGVSPPTSNFGGMSMTDVTLEQALLRMQDMARENAELRDYLKENNEMMKKQFETLSQWKQRVHDANVMNREKFEQTRALITSLREDNKELHKKIKEYDNKEDAQNGRIKTLESELSSIKSAKAFSDQLAFNVVKQAEEKGVEFRDDEMHMKDTVYVASVEKEERILELEADVTSRIQEIEKLKERLSHLEHENSQFRQNTEQLLKDLENTQNLKQQIQQENQELRQETVNLQLQLQSMLAETKNSLKQNPVSDLAVYTLRGTQRADGVPGCSEIPLSLMDNGLEEKGSNPQPHTADYWHEGSVAVTVEVEQLRTQLHNEQLQVQLLTAGNDDSQRQISEFKGQVEQLQLLLDELKKEHAEKIVKLNHEHKVQVEKFERQRSEEVSQTNQQSLQATYTGDVQTLRCQVLTLINEVHETQNKLTAAQKSIEGKNARIKELESYTSQMMEDSHQGMQQMQQKLAVMERHFRDEQQAHTTTKHQMNDLRVSFNQLISDYKEVLDTFDQYKSDQERRSAPGENQRELMDKIDYLTVQLVATEETINHEEEKIAKLHEELQEKEETLTVFQAQAEVFKSDFAAERDARQQLAAERDRLISELEAVQLQNQGLVDQLTAYSQRQLAEMQLRASHGAGSSGYHQQNYPSRNFGSHHGGAAGAGMNRMGGDSGRQQGLAFLQGGQSAAQAAQNYGAGGQNVHIAQHENTESALPRVPQNPYGYHLHGPLATSRSHLQPRQHDEEEQQIFQCPSCQQCLPDYDTLNLHVQECLELQSTETSRT